MNSIQILRRGIITAVFCVLVSVSAMELTRAEDPGVRSASSQPSAPTENQTSTTEADQEEKARIRHFVLQVPAIRKLGGVSNDDTKVKHLSGRYYVAKVVYAKGNMWRLYMVRGKDISEIGVAAGERGLDYCLSVLITEQSHPKSKAELTRLAKKTIQALSADYGIFVERNTDIPGYDKAPLARDLERVIRPAWTYVSKGPRGKKITHYVVYTYQRIGGQIFRHEFEFGARRTHAAATIRLATGIGDAQYLE